MPGAFLFANRAAARRHRRPRLRRLARPAAQRRRGDAPSKQREARDAVLPVYDLDPRRARRARRRRWPSSSPAGAACWRRDGAGGGSPRGGRRGAGCRASDRDAAAAERRQAHAPSRRSCWRARGSRPTSRTACAASSPRCCAAAWWPTRSCCSRTACTGSPCATSPPAPRASTSTSSTTSAIPARRATCSRPRCASWGGFSAAERRLLVDLLVENLPPNLLLNRSETLLRQEAAAAGGRPGVQPDPPGAGDRPQGRPDRSGPRPHHRPDAGRAAARPPAAAARRHPGAAGAGRRWWSGSPSGGERVANHEPRPAVRREPAAPPRSRCWARSSASWWPTPSRSPSTSAPLNSVHSYAYAIPFASLALVGDAAARAQHRADAVGALLRPRRPPDRSTATRSGWSSTASPARSAPIYALECYQFRHRLVMVRVGLVVGGVNLVMVLILTAFATAGRGLVQVGFDLVCAFAGGLLVTAAASFALPILEWALGITTDIKLVELSNTNLPLLRRLAFEAPGTFQHSLMVANLAKEGCEAIGADPVLAYTGGPLPRRRQGAAPRLLRREPAPRPQPARQAAPLDERADPDQPRQGRRRAGPRAQPAAGDRGRRPAAPRHAADQVLLQQGRWSRRTPTPPTSPRRSTAIPAPSRRTR